MEFKDLPMQFQEMAANIVRSQLATLDLSTVEKETIDTISGNVRRAFIGLYEEKQLSDNQDLHEKYFLDLMDIINKGFGLLMEKKGIRIEPLENCFVTARYEIANNVISLRAAACCSVLSKSLIFRIRELRVSLTSNPISSSRGLVIKEFSTGEVECVRRTRVSIRH